jgi:hypothetical protein
MKLQGSGTPGASRENQEGIGSPKLSEIVSDGMSATADKYRMIAPGREPAPAAR